MGGAFSVVIMMEAGCCWGVESQSAKCPTLHAVVQAVRAGCIS